MIKRAPELLLVIYFLIPASTFASSFADAMGINAELAYPTTVSNLSSELDRKAGINGSATGTLMFNTDFMDKLWFVPSATVNYFSTAQPVQIDDRRFLFSQWIDLYVNGGLNYNLTGNWTVKARVFARRDYTQQFSDEDFGSGLYDFIDLGAYAENDLKFGGNKINFGIKYSDKKFPNFTYLSGPVILSSGGAFTPGPQKEKDNLTYDGYAFLTLDLWQSGWQTDISMKYDYTPYIEQRIVNRDGTFDDGRRVDRLASLSADLPYYADKVSYFKLGYTINVQTTDQNFIDTRGGIDPSQYVFTENYYSNIEHIFSAVLAYEFDMKVFNGYRPVGEFGVEYSATGYPGRYAKDSDGNYTDARQMDDSYTVSLNIKQAVNDYWSIYLDGKYSRYESNMKWEAFGPYNFTLLTLAAGTSLNF